MRKAPAEVPFFIHIPKTGGTIVRALITRNCEIGDVLSVYGNYFEINDALSNNIQNKDKFSIIQGHFYCGSHYQLNIRNPAYYVFLRNPVERMFSDIDYVLRKPDHPFYNVLGGGRKSVSEVLDLAKAHHYYVDTMTHYVSGLYFTRPADLSDLHRAIDNLWKSKFVGITEQFEESFLLMAKALGWRNLIVEKLNTAKSKTEITDQLRSSANQVLALDNALYAVAQDIVRESIKMHGALLLEAAEQLREIYRAQKELAPEREFDEYLVGDKLALQQQMESLITATSPLGCWIAGITSAAG